MAQILINSLTIQEINSALLRVQRSIKNNQASLPTSINKVISSGSSTLGSKYDDSNILKQISALNASLTQALQSIDKLEKRIKNDEDDISANASNIASLQDLVANINFTYDEETNIIHFTNCNGDTVDIPLVDTTYNFTFDTTTHKLTIHNNLTDTDVFDEVVDTIYSFVWNNGTLTISDNRSQSPVLTVNFDSRYYTESEIQTLVLDLIPSTATRLNQLADKNFVNSSIETSTATFRGTFDIFNELKNEPGDKNDYAFVKELNETSGLYEYSRYKWMPDVDPDTNSHWYYEYTLNTSGFTADQLAAINSGITSNLVAKITDVWNCKITFCQSGTCVGSFHLNQCCDDTVCLTDCLVKLEQLCGNAERPLLFTGNGYTTGCICPVYSSNGVSLTYNACCGCLRIGNFNCNCCDQLYLRHNRGLVRNGPKGSQTDAFFIMKENNCKDNCSLGMGVGSDNINRGIFDYCTASGATSPTWRWLQYWDAEKENHNLPICANRGYYGELLGNNKTLYSCTTEIPSNIRRYALICFDKTYCYNTNTHNVSACIEIDIYTSKYFVWKDGTTLRSWWCTTGIDPNDSAYGAYCFGKTSDDSETSNCFWITYSAYRAPVIKSVRKISIICNVTVAPEGVIFVEPTNRNSYINVYSGTTCKCTLQGPSALCLGSAAWCNASDFIPSTFSTAVTINGTSKTTLTDVINTLDNTYQPKAYGFACSGSHYRYICLGNIPISSGSVSYASLTMNIFSYNCQITNTYPIGTVQIDLSSGSSATGFNIRGWSDILLNSDTANTNSPRLWVRKDTACGVYRLYLDSAYNYLRPKIQINWNANFTIGDLKCYSSMTGDALWNSVDCNDIVYVNKINKWCVDTSGNVCCMGYLCGCGASLTNFVFCKAANTNGSGWPTYRLIYDVTSWWNAAGTSSSNVSARGIVGRIAGYRNVGFGLSSLADIEAWTNYGRGSVTDPLNSTVLKLTYCYRGSVNNVPIILKNTATDGDKYYLAIRQSGYDNVPYRFDGFSFNGAWLTCNICAVDSSGTLPACWSVAIAGVLCSAASLELYGANPYIDFHTANSTCDYTHRIVASCGSSATTYGNLAFTVNCVNNAGAVTTGNSFYMCPNGVFFAKYLDSTGWTRTPVLMSLGASGASKICDVTIRACCTNVSCALICSDWTFCGCNGLLYSSGYSSKRSSSSISFPASSTTYVLLGYIQSMQLDNEYQLGFYVSGSNVVNNGVLKWIGSNAGVQGQNNIELKLSNYCNNAYGVTGVGFIKNGSAWNCSTCVILRICNASASAFSWSVGLYKNQIGYNFTQNICCLGSTALTFDCLINIPASCRNFTYRNGGVCIGDTGYLVSNNIYTNNIYSRSPAANQSCCLLFTAYCCNASALTTSTMCFLPTGVLCVPRVVNSGYPQKWSQYIDLTSQSADCFYPVTWDSDNAFESEIEIRSPQLSGSCPYNQNYIHFFERAGGWNDTPKSLYIQTLTRYDNNEKVIGCIGYGTGSSLTSAIWLRGGRSYCANANVLLSAHTANWENGSSGSCSIYSVGTSLCGGTNTQVTVFGNGATETLGSYNSSNLKLAGTLNVCGNINTANNICAAGYISVGGANCAGYYCTVRTCVSYSMTANTVYYIKVGRISVCCGRNENDIMIEAYGSSSVDRVRIRWNSSDANCALVSDSIQIDQSNWSTNNGIHCVGWIKTGTGWNCANDIYLVFKAPATASYTFSLFRNRLGDWGTSWSCSTTKPSFTYSLCTKPNGNKAFHWTNGTLSYNTLKSENDIYQFNYKKPLNDGYSVFYGLWDITCQVCGNSSEWAGFNGKVLVNNDSSSNVSIGETVDIINTFKQNNTYCLSFANRLGNNFVKPAIMCCIGTSSTTNKYYLGFILSQGELDFTFNGFLTKCCFLNTPQIFYWNSSDSCYHLGSCTAAQKGVITIQGTEAEISSTSTCCFNRLIYLRTVDMCGCAGTALASNFGDNVVHCLQLPNIINAISFRAQQGSFCCRLTIPLCHTVSTYCQGDIWLTGV